MLFKKHFDVKAGRYPTSCWFKSIYRWTSRAIFVIKHQKLFKVNRHLDCPVSWAARSVAEEGGTCSLQGGFLIWDRIQALPRTKYSPSFPKS